MFKGAALFAFMFLMIAPKSREFLVGVFTKSLETLDKGAPESYITVALLVLVPLAAIFVVKSWPQRAEPANQMAKYRRNYDD